MTDHIALEAQRPRGTGRLLVRFAAEIGARRRYQMLADALGGELATAATSPDEVEAIADVPVGEQSPAALLSKLAIGVVPASGEFGIGALRERMQTMAGVLSVRPEYYLFAAGEPIPDTDAATWGVTAVGAMESRFTGRGIRLAILDTGIELDHPDFSNRPIVSRSFVSGESADDVQGHGTHCAGTAGSSARISAATRYGVAPDVEIHNGKVLNDRGSGREGDILSGMIWAVDSGCEIVSMSLGRSVRVGEARTPEYEEAGAYALERGSLIIAAAGNDSQRSTGFIAPVSEPANAPSIMAVAAIDSLLRVADFSNAGIEGGGGEIDIAAPGVAVLSAVPMPRQYASFNGTSMACPHVAGVAALLAESDPALRGRALWDALVRNARPIDPPARDRGAGLVQAPR